MMDSSQPNEAERSSSRGSATIEPAPINLHQRTTSSSSARSSVSNSSSAASGHVHDFVVLTTYPVEPDHKLMTIVRLLNDGRPDLLSNAVHIGTGVNEGIVINKPASIMDYNRIQAGQKERQQPPSAKMSFKVFLINSETNKLKLEHRTLRFWLDHSPVTSTSANDDNNGSLNGANFKPVRSFANIRQESSQLAQAYFCQLIGTKPDDFPKDYTGFIMKLMRLLKVAQFKRVVKMEVELRQLAYDEQHHQVKPPSPVSSIDGSQGGETGRSSPLTSQKVLDIIESSYPNPISVKEICSTTQSDETTVRKFVDELASKEKINTTDNGQNYTRTTKPIDSKVNMVKQMPKVTRSQQPVIAIITAQYCEKLAVDSMISDKETFVRYRVTSGQDSGSGAGEMTSNYVYTLGNIGDHRVVSTKLTSVGHSRGALIAAGNATTRLLGTFPEIEYVFLVGCGGGVVNYSDFSSHVRLGDIVVSHLPSASSSDLDRSSEDISNASLNDTNLSRHNGGSKSLTDYVYVHCRPKQQDTNAQSSERSKSTSIPISYSVHKNLKRAMNGLSLDSSAGQAPHDLAAVDNNNQPSKSEEAQRSLNESGDASTSAHNLSTNTTVKPQLTYEECHFRLWRPAQLNLQELAQRLWSQGLKDQKHRIWEYYIDEGIKSLRQQETDATRPTPDTDKLHMSIGLNDTIEVNHPEAGENEVDLRRDGRPMCHFGPIGSGRPAVSNETLKQRMISEFGLCAFDSEFDPVVESIYGNCKESYIMIRGISDYKDGRKKKDWQQYSALVAAAFMKSIIVNLKPLNH